MSLQVEYGFWKGEHFSQLFYKDSANCFMSCILSSDVD